MKNPWVVVGVILVVLFGGAILLSSMSNEKNNAGVMLNEHVKGNSEASVVLVEYSDFQCPACAAFQPAVSELLAEYGDSIRFEYRHFPLPIHQFAINAAIAAEAAGQQGKFFEYHDLLFQNQQEWSTMAVPAGLFSSYAEQLGLDVEKFQRHLKSTVIRDAVRDSSKEARELNLTSTPTFFLNGEKMEFSTFEEFIGQVAIAVDPNMATASGTPTTGEVKFGL
jgi:protein-disulfide isomerase